MTYSIIFVFGAVLAGLLQKFGLSAEFFMWLVLAVLLLGLSLADYRRHIIPGAMLGAAVISRMIFFFCFGFSWEIFWKICFSAFSFAAFLGLIVWGADGFFGRRTMGGGDLKLVFVLGLYFSWTQMLYLLLAASVMGIVLSLIPLRKVRRNERNRGEPQDEAKKKKRLWGSREIPFGPSLAASAVLTVFFVP